MGINRRLSVLPNTQTTTEAPSMRDLKEGLFLLGRGCVGEGGTSARCEGGWVVRVLGGPRSSGPAGVLGLRSALGATDGAGVEGQRSLLLHLLFLRLLLHLLFPFLILLLPPLPSPLSSFASFLLFLPIILILLIISSSSSFLLILLLLSLLLFLLLRLLLLPLLLLLISPFLFVLLLIFLLPLYFCFSPVCPSPSPSSSSIICG